MNMMREDIILYTASSGSAGCCRFGYWAVLPCRCDCFGDGAPWLLFLEIVVSACNHEVRVANTGFDLLDKAFLGSKKQ